MLINKHDTEEGLIYNASAFGRCVELW